MPDADINYTAVLAAAVITMVVGSLWYSPALLGRAWSKAIGKKMENMKGGGVSYVIAAVGSLLQAYVLAHFVDYTNANTFAEGATTALWIWAGFIAVTTAVHYAFEGRSLNLWRINVGYFLIVLLINGGLLAVWR